MKLEINENNGLLKSGLKQLKSFNGYVGFIVRHLSTDSTVTCNRSEWDSLKQIYKNDEDYSPDFTFSDNRVKKLNENTIEVKFTVPIKFFPPKIQTDSWEAIKASGLLNSIPYDKLRTLTRLYGELDSTSTGTSPDDFMIYVRNEKFDVRSFYKLTKNIEFEYQIKTWRVGESIEEIMKY